MIEWTDEAIEAARLAFDHAKTIPDAYPMRAALDAAVKAQGFSYSEGIIAPIGSERIRAVNAFRSRIRDEALDKAAREVEECDGWEAGRVADRIRALKDKPND